MQTLLTDFFSSPRASSISNGVFGIKNSTPRKAKSPRVKSFVTTGNDRRLRQTMIDAGQKKVGLEHCIQCGMVYSVDEQKDVAQHHDFHNRFTEVKEFRVTVNQIDTWKSAIFHEEVTVPFEGHLFLVKPTSTVSLKRKLENVLSNYVNHELGYSSDLPIWNQNGQRKALVYIAKSNSPNPAFIAGILLIDKTEEVIVMPQQKGTFLGIDRIWVHSRLRRKGMATFLLDSARRLLPPEGKEEIPRTRVAFADPSEMGVKLATSYVGDKENGRYIIYSTVPTPHEDAILSAISK